MNIHPNLHPPPSAPDNTANIATDTNVDDLNWG